MPIYELQQRVTVTLKMIDHVNRKSSVSRTKVEPGLRCKLLGRKGQDYLLQPVGDPTSEIQAPMASWGRWKKV